MVTILGIHPGHDAGACLIKDGKILAATDEERFTRKKHWGGDYPKNSVKWILDSTKTKIGDIDVIAIPAKEFSNFEKSKMALRYLKYPSEIIKRLKKSKKGMLGYSYFYSIIKKGVEEQFGQISIPIKGVDHHLAHAAAAYYMSGFREPVIITCDGVGGGVSATVNVVENGKIKRIASTLEPGSLGHFYEALTEALGFLINNGEYKVMGLAAYGDWRKGYKELKRLAPRLDGLVFKRKPWGIYSENVNNFWAVHIEEAAYVKLLIDKYGKENIAAAGQRVLEDLMVEWVRNVIARTGKRQICAAGGVFLNVKANKRIREELGVDFFVFPHAGDGGLSGGCALYMNALIKPSTKFERIEKLYLGPEYSNDEILKELRKHREIKFKEVEDVSEETGKLLAKGKIVGWFQGRMEWGPRALGSRTILANSTDGKYRDKINREIKFREEWRPFTPSMLYEAKDEYLLKPVDAPFMIMSFDVPEDKVNKIPAVIHVDGTARPQLVKKEINEKYWNVIKSFEKKTGIPVVLNTSFNRKGEPIVCSPADAIKTFLGSGMEYLAIGDFVVEKRRK